MQQQQAQGPPPIMAPLGGPTHSVGDQYAKERQVSPSDESRTLMGAEASSEVTEEMVIAADRAHVRLRSPLPVSSDVILGNQPSSSSTDIDTPLLLPGGAGVRCSVALVDVPDLAQHPAGSAEPG
jgi:hypothetical protein